MGAGSLVAAAARLRDALAGVRLDGVAHVLQPLDYAWAPHEAYLRRYGARPGRLLLLGMNPGPWGMGQTGVPFADPAWARGWMGIDAPVRAPVAAAHPARPVLGFASTRRDPSGDKLYGWAQARFGSADAFFARCFVLNYCPLMLLDAQGRNVTLDALPRAAFGRLAPACDAWTREALAALRPARAAALGRFVAARLATLDAERPLGVPVTAVRHPSPAHPANNAGWGDEINALLGAATGGPAGL